MGCFDETCGLSGLAIKRGDPVRFGLISSTGRTRGSDACGMYQFWTPLFSSTYDEYGSIKWSEIQQRDLFDFVFGLLMPHIRRREDFPEYTLLSQEPQKVFTDLIHQSRVIQLRGKPTPEQRQVYIWMCHEWAFDAVQKIGLDSPFCYEQVVVQHAENYVTNGYIPNESQYRDSEGKITDMEEWGKQWFESTHKEIHWIEGDQGFLTHNFRYYVLYSRATEMLREYREQFKQAITETACLIAKLQFLRKGIMPSFFSGQQHEDNFALGEWTQLVADKAKEQSRHYQDM
jgi:hypothetical protein